MASLGRNEIFDAAVRILLIQDRCVTVHFRGDEGLSIQFPTTRRLAEHLKVPHYYVLPYFAEMEQSGLIKRVERVGISTTPAGTALLVSLMASRYPAEAAAVLGARIFSELLRVAGSEDMDR
jgi:DNA-binding transcriptional regulator YhcF (GntR family)